MESAGLTKRQENYILKFTERGWFVLVTGVNEDEPIDFIRDEYSIAQRISTLSAYDIYEAFRLWVGHAGINLPGRRLDTPPTIDNVNKRAQFLLNGAIDSFARQFPGKTNIPTRISVPKELVQATFEDRWRTFQTNDGLTDKGKALKTALIDQFQFDFDIDETMETALAKLSPERKAWLNELVTPAGSDEDFHTLISMNDVDGTLIPDKLSEEQAEALAEETGRTAQDVKEEYEAERLQINPKLVDVLLHNQLNGVEELFITGRNATELLPIATQMVEAMHELYEAYDLGSPPPFRSIVGNGTKLVEYSKNQAGEVVCELISSVELETNDLDVLTGIIAAHLDVSVEDLVKTYGIVDGNVIDPKLPWVASESDAPVDSPPTLKVGAVEAQAPFWIWVGDNVVDGGTPKSDFIRLRQVSADDEAHTAIRRALLKSPTLAVSDPLEDVNGTSEMLLTHILADKGGAVKAYAMAKFFSLDELKALTKFETELVWNAVRNTVVGRGNGENDAPLGWNTRFYPTVTSPESLQENRTVFTPDPPRVGQDSEAALEAAAARRVAANNHPLSRYPQTSDVAAAARLVRGN